MGSPDFDGIASRITEVSTVQTFPFRHLRNTADPTPWKSHEQLILKVPPSDLFDLRSVRAYSDFSGSNYDQLSPDEQTRLLGTHWTAKEIAHRLNDLAVNYLRLAGDIDIAELAAEFVQGLAGREQRLPLALLHHRDGNHDSRTILLGLILEYLGLDADKGISVFAFAVQNSNYGQRFLVFGDASGMPGGESTFITDMGISRYALFFPIDKDGKIIIGPMPDKEECVRYGLPDEGFSRVAIFQGIPRAS